MNVEIEEKLIASDQIDLLAKLKTAPLDTDEDLIALAELFDEDEIGD